MGREGESCVYAGGDLMVWTRAPSDAISAISWVLDFQGFQHGFGHFTPGALCRALFLQLHPVSVHKVIFGNFWSIIFFHRILSDFS